MSSQRPSTAEGLLPAAPPDATYFSLPDAAQYFGLISSTYSYFIFAAKNVGGAILCEAQGTFLKAFKRVLQFVSQISAVSSKLQIIPAMELPHMNKSYN